MTGDSLDKVNAVIHLVVYEFFFDMYLSIYILKSQATRTKCFYVELKNKASTGGSDWLSALLFTCEGIGKVMILNIHCHFCIDLSVLIFL